MSQARTVWIKAAQPLHLAARLLFRQWCWQFTLEAIEAEQ
jgi:hypothetical protein